MSEDKALQPIVEDTTPSIKQFKSMWNDPELLKIAFQAATYLSKSNLVPEMYQNRPDNCLIALDIANRTGYSPLMIMQQMFVVKGKPAWSGQASIALVNGSGRYMEPLNPIFIGDIGTPNWGCYMATKNLKGETVIGATVTMQMAKDEGWLDKSGSKWKTMPEIMLQYRAGAFFARVHCPDVLLGIQTIEEVQDVYGYEETAKQTTRLTLDIGGADDAKED